MLMASIHMIQNQPLHHPAGLQCLEKAPLGDDAEAAAELGAALPSLGQLTCLALHDMRFGGRGLPQELASLLQLQRFHWLWKPPPEESAAPTELGWARQPGSIPGGAWLHSLRHAALTDEEACNWLPALAAAGQLEALHVYGQVWNSSQALLAVAEWAATHPSLRWLAFHLTAVPPAHKPEWLLGEERQLQAALERLPPSLDAQVRRVDLPPLLALPYAEL